MPSSQPSTALSGSANAPSGPCFIRSRKGSFRFEKTFKPDDSCRLLACVNGYFQSLEIFDADGRRWRVAEIETPHKTHALAKFLANTVYNPTKAVHITWAPPAAYTIEELREAYIAAVELDDDILTQFVECDELVPKIRAAADLAALVKVYRWAETDRD